MMMVIFAQDFLTKNRAKAYNSSTEYKAHRLHQATIWLSEGLIHAKLSKEDLLILKGSDPKKVFLALFLKKKTTVSNGWLSEQLKMKGAANVSYLLNKTDIAKLITRVPERLINFAKIQGFQI